MPEEFNRGPICPYKKYLSEDVALYKKALVYAVDFRKASFRQSGEPYIIHRFKWRILAKAETGCCDDHTDFCMM